jgi:glycosyltransferase involved in cell wall biosynthesis
MKIVYLTNVRLPTEKAHGLQIMKMCEAFAKEHEVELVAPMRLNPLTEDPFKFFGVEQNFTITKLPCLDLISLGLGRFGYWVEMITFLLSAKIYLLFKKFDLLYTREFALGSFFRNYVLEVHELPQAASRYHVRSWNKAQKLIVLTSLLKKDLAEKGIRAEKILVSPDGVDVGEIAAAIPANNTFGKKVVMYTGSLTLYGWKGVDTLVEAAKQLKDKVATVFIGGSEAEVRKLEENIGGSHAENIKFLGRLPHADIPANIKMADVLVLPNKPGDNNSERYTSPLKLFEYMASGVPIVASDLPSLREVLNERNCTFFRAGDVGSLAGAIQSVLDGPASANAKAQQAMEDVNNYTWGIRAKNILNFLK